MKKTLALTAAVLISLAVPAFAQTGADVSSDVGAVQKDNTAMSKDQANLAANRAAKAQDKANGNWGSQAVDSVKIGANKTAISEKSTEKNYDTKTLNGDVNSATQQQK